MPQNNKCNSLYTISICENLWQIFLILFEDLLRYLYKFREKQVHSVSFHLLNPKYGLGLNPAQFHIFSYKSYAMLPSLTLRTSHPSFDLPGQKKKSLTLIFGMQVNLADLKATIEARVKQPPMYQTSSALERSARQMVVLTNCSE